jgi:hypothetical protein
MSPGFDIQRLAAGVRFAAITVCPLDGQAARDKAHLRPTFTVAALNPLIRATIIFTPHFLS